MSKSERIFCMGRGLIAAMKCCTITIGGENMDSMEVLKKWVAESSNIVFFGGAGVSTE